MKKLSVSVTLALVAMVVVSTAAYAQPKVTTFDNGAEGWAGNHFNEIGTDGGDHGNYLNTTSIDYANNNAILVGWYDTKNSSDPAFIGDYTEKGEVRICVDMNVNIFDYYSWMGPIAAEEYREVAISLRDLDMQYQDPNYPNYPPFPYAEAQFFVSYMQSRDDGWATYCADVTDVNAFELPAGWTGYGGGEDPDTYMPIFPPGYGWSDLLAGVDEIHVNALLHGWSYSYANVYDIDFDNMSIGPIPCVGQEPTIFVSNGIVYGGPRDGKQYNGVLKGTNGNDVIAGTAGNDTILGFDGNDFICGRAGNDQLIGSFGDDFIDGGPGDDTILGQQHDDFLIGGEGRDNMNGGPGDDTCVAGEVFNSCGEEFSSPGIHNTIDGDSLPENPSQFGQSTSSTTTVGSGETASEPTATGRVIGFKGRGQRRTR